MGQRPQKQSANRPLREPRRGVCAETVGRVAGELPIEASQARMTCAELCGLLVQIARRTRGLVFVGDGVSDPDDDPAFNHRPGR